MATATDPWQSRSSGSADVSKAFGAARSSTPRLDLDILRGETLTIMGGSGVGKSVMLKMLIGLLTPDPA